MNKKGLGALGIIAAILFINFKFNNKKQLSVEDFTDDEVKKTVKIRKRIPASVKQNTTVKNTELYKPQVSLSSREAESNLIDEPEKNIETTKLDGGSYHYGNNGDQGNWSGGRGNNYNTNPHPGSTESQTSSTPSSSKSSAFGTPFFNTPWPTTSSSSGSDSASDSLSCTSNLGGGAYGSPIEVSLNCSSPSEIRYCVSVGSCCDPLSSGEIYSSKFVIGEDPGDYCLSYYGRDAGNEESKIIQTNFSFNQTLPKFEVLHPKRYYQTTELSGTSHIMSPMFGLVNMGVGVINLKSNDPGPAGLNLDCEEIITNYVSLTSPAPKVILDFFSTAAVSTNDQLNVPLRPDQLTYGDNYITSYMANKNFITPRYACATTKVRLEDFDYFQADASHAVAGTNQVREFSGGFSGYGFFEEGNDINRSPASNITSGAQEEKLESGLFSVIY